MLKRKSKYQKLVEIEQKRILQLKRERSELKRIIMHDVTYAKDYYTDKIKEIDDYLESRFQYGR